MNASNKRRIDEKSAAFIRGGGVYYRRLFK